MHILSLMDLQLTLPLTDILTSLPLLGLYAETHYRFPIRFSRYYKREPELIFDTPWRLEPGQILRLYLVVKDAHKFPVLLNHVEFEVYQDQQNILTERVELGREIVSQQTYLRFDINLPGTVKGEIEILPRLSYVTGQRERHLLIDNYTGIPKQALKVMIAADPLPGAKGWQRGDLHLHSSFTTDQIEFGANIEQTRDAAAMLGLHFIAATDHSYDLDDYPDDYTRNDPSLAKWQESRERFAHLNRSAKEPLIIPGEEISVSNAVGMTVHFLHYGDPVYFPGNGDSGEDWPKTRSQLTIGDVLRDRSPGTVSVAAHSGYRFPWLQRALLKRGWWDAPDHDHDGLDGAQILCGTPSSESFHRSRQLWIDALLRGKRLAAIGGSDGHGNFNRNWHVNMPMWSLGTHGDQIFGQVWTLVKADQPELPQLMQALKEMKTGLSTGPFGDIRLTQEGRDAGIGEEMSIRANIPVDIEVVAASSAEFGIEIDVYLYAGSRKSATESLLYTESLHGEHTLRTLTLDLNGFDYVRLELASEGSRWPGVYLSTPIWLHPTTAS